MFKATKVSNFSYTARAGCIVCAAPRNNNSAFCLIHGVILFDLCIPPVCFILLIIITNHAHDQLGLAQRIALISSCCVSCSLLKTTPFSPFTTLASVMLLLLLSHILNVQTLSRIELELNNDRLK